MIPPAQLPRVAQELLSSGRAEEALALIRPFALQPYAAYEVLSAYAASLKGLGRFDEAVSVLRRATAARPASVVAWHNLAALLGDMGQGGESLEAIDRALAAGGDAAASWLVRARACWMLDDAVGAEKSYRNALTRAPGMTDAACELAQLLWLRTADPDAASAHLASALEAGANASQILFTQSQLLRFDGRAEDARMRLIDAAGQRPGDPGVLLLGARAAVETDATRLALEFVDRAAQITPDYHQIHLHRTMALMAEGRAAEALASARQAARAAPHAQDAWGWVATAARAAGDPQYATLCDYEALVRVYDLDAPVGWTSMDGFLSDLGTALEILHTDRTHRLEQSARAGTQTFGDLRRSSDPAIKAFFEAIDGPIRRYADHLGAGPDPVRSRNRGACRLSGAWSVHLRDGGHHIDHFHPTAWVSSAFYVRVPKRALEIDRQGWLRFGQPPFPTRPPLLADHFVEPVPGRLVLFPSYMWHGTVPFHGDETRLSIAFDVVPA